LIRLPRPLRSPGIARRYRIAATAALAGHGPRYRIAATAALAGRGPALPDCCDRCARRAWPGATGLLRPLRSPGVARRYRIAATAALAGHGPRYRIAAPAALAGHGPALPDCCHRCARRAWPGATGLLRPLRSPRMARATGLLRPLRSPGMARRYPRNGATPR